MPSCLPHPQPPAHLDASCYGQCQCQALTLSVPMQLAHIATASPAATTHLRAVPLGMDGKELHCIHVLLRGGACHLPPQNVAFLPRNVKYSC